MGESDFEKPLRDLEGRIEALGAHRGHPAPEREKQRERLLHELSLRRREIYSNLTPWQKTQVARHPNRPYMLDYVSALFTDFTELAGDRRFADDPALVCGFAYYKGKPVAVVGHQKGRDTKQKIYRNFGMPNPEGYRKALRVMRLAEKFGRPIITFVDTPGAYPGLEAEEREALLLHHFQERSVDEIADLMGKSPSSVRRLLGRATVRLGARIKEASHAG